MTDDELREIADRAERVYNARHVATSEDEVARLTKENKQLRGLLAEVRDWGNSADIRGVFAYLHVHNWKWNEEFLTKAQDMWKRVGEALEAK